MPRPWYVDPRHIPRASSEHPYEVRERLSSRGLQRVDEPGGRAITEINSPSQELHVLVVAYLRKGETDAHLACGFTIGTSRVYRLPTRP